MRFVQRRPDQIVHRGIDDDEILGLAMLHIDHAGNQDAGVADDQTARLEHQRTAEIMRDALDHGCIGVRRRRRLAVHVIGNAEAAAEIDMRDRMAVGAQGRTNSASIGNAVSICSRSVIWLPICMSTPVTSMPGSFAARA